MGDDKANQPIPLLGPDTIRVQLFLSGNRMLAHMESGVGVSGRSVAMDYDLCADHAPRIQASNAVHANNSAPSIWRKHDG